MTAFFVFTFKPQFLSHPALYSLSISSQAPGINHDLSEKQKKKWPLTAESSDFQQPRVISVLSYYLTSVINPAFCRFDAVQPVHPSCPATFHLQSHKRDTLLCGGSPTVDTRPWGRFTCTSVSPLVTIRYHKFLFFSIGILYKLYKYKLETLPILHRGRCDKLLFARVRSKNAVIASQCA